jgi:hypothetical protein
MLFFNSLWSTKTGQQPLHAATTLDSKVLLLLL